VKIAFPVVTAAVLLLALTACSTGSAPTGGATSVQNSATAKPAPGSSSAAPSRTYTADELAAIVKKAQSTLGVKGTILDDAQSKSLLKKLGDTSIVGQLTKEDATITPAACAADLNNAIPAAQKLGSAGNSISASLTYSKGALGISSTTDGVLPDSVTSGLGTSFASLYSKCSTMKIAVQGQVASLKLAKIDATTDADQTFAFTETIEIAGKKITTTIVEGILGNLVIGMSALGGSEQDAVDAVNAVVAATK
jgi:hypothetical protein